MKQYTFWLKSAAIAQLANVIIHLPSFFISPPPTNETEKQLFRLMDTYKFDMGTGFHRTMSDLTLVFSACLCLLCLLGGLLNLYLLRKNIDSTITQGVITINLIVFGILSILTLVYTFILPIVSIGLIVIFLAISLFSVSKVDQISRKTLL